MLCKGSIKLKIWSVKIRGWMINCWNWGFNCRINKCLGIKRRRWGQNMAKIKRLNCYWVRGHSQKHRKKQWMIKETERRAKLSYRNINHNCTPLKLSKWTILIEWKLYNTWKIIETWIKNKLFWIQPFPLPQKVQTLNY